MNRLIAFLTPDTSSTTVNWASLLMRLAFGIYMIPHGYSKLMGFEQRSENFMNFLGLSGPISLGLIIFAEFFCAIAITLGLGTRLATIPLIIGMAVATFWAHADDPILDREGPMLFFASFIVILILGAGKYSVDALIFKKKRAAY